MIRIKTKGATYDAMLKNGFVYVLVMPVKATGLMQFRAAVRDSVCGIEPFSDGAAPRAPRSSPRCFLRMRRLRR